MTIASAVLSVVLLFQAGPAPPKFTARLLAAHESIQPGGQTELLVEIEVSQPWHIYHPVVLDTGLATSVKFTTPPGVTIGDLRYPVPSLGKSAGLEYLEHSGKIRAIGTLKLTDDVEPGQSLPIKAEVSGLACIELCLPVKADATLSLPVTNEQGKPANEKLFKEARDDLAPTLADAPYLKGSELRVSQATVGIDEPAELIATIRVQKGHHIQDRDPGVETLIASRLFVEKIAGVEFAEEKKQIWPEPHVRDFPGFGKVREQSGQVNIRVPFKIIDKEFPSGPVAVRVLFRFQVCTDAGQCYRPEIAEGFVRFAAATPNAPLTASAVTSETPATAAGDAGVAGDTTAGAGETNLLLVLVFGFLGGLILNVMPCVLPVISIKVIGFMQQGGEDPKRVFRLGLAFCAGIMVWFWLFAALSARGQLPLQYPSVVIGVGTILFVLALNMFGVFEIVLPGAAAGKLDQAASREGYAGTFFKGFLATLLGTACTAPFLAGALLYAASQPAHIGFLVFSAAGLGMGAPYLLLAANPAWMKFIPKPGMWMITFKQAMSFILLGTAVWLLWILGRQIGADGVVWTVAFWGFLGMGAWMIGKITPAWNTGPRLAMWAGACAVVLIGYWFSYGLMYKPEQRQLVSLTPEAIVTYVAETGWDDGIPWAPYGKGIAEELAERGYMVYVDYTAAWCPVCLANKGGVLETDRIREQMREMGVIPIKADFTNENPEMLAEINAFGRPTVPLNLIYPAEHPEKVITLPVILTQKIVSTKLNEAGPSTNRRGLVRKDR